MVKILVTFGNKTEEQIELTRVPGIGEKLAFSDHDYEVTKVIHLVEPKGEVVAVVKVSGQRLDGKHVTSVVTVSHLHF